MAKNWWEVGTLVAEPDKPKNWWESDTPVAPSVVQPASTSAQTNAPNPITQAMQASTAKINQDFYNRRGEAEAKRALAARSGPMGFTAGDAFGFQPELIGSKINEDIAEGIVTTPQHIERGIVGAAEATANLPSDIINSMGQASAAAVSRDTAMRNVNRMPQLMERVGKPAQEFKPVPRFDFSGAKIPVPQEMESVTGNLIEGLAQFVAGRFAMGKAAPGGGFAPQLGKDIATTGAVFDGNAPRLADMIDPASVPEGPLRDGVLWLKTQPSDSPVWGRIKNMVEDLTMSGPALLPQGGIRAVQAVGDALTAPRRLTPTNAGGAQPPRPQAAPAPTGAPAATPSPAPVTAVPTTGPQAAASGGPPPIQPPAVPTQAANAGPPAGNLRPVQSPPLGQVTGDYANLHPKVQAAFKRLLENSGVEPQRIPAILQNLDQLPTDRAEMVVTELIRKFGAGDPKLQTNITSVAGDLAVNAPKAGGDNAQAIVKGNIRKYMDQEAPYIESVAEKNFGPGVVFTDKQIEDNLKQMRGQYHELLKPTNIYAGKRSAANKLAINTARTNLANYLKRVDTAQEIPDWLKRDTLNTLNRDLREMGLEPIERNSIGQQFTWNELVDKYPTQIAHALQSTYARASREADMAKLGDIKAGAFQRDMEEMRGRSRVRANAANPADRGYGLLHLLEEAVPGYKDLRVGFGTEHGARTALTLPQRFMSAVNDEVKFAALLDDLDELTPDQLKTAENQITTLVRNAVRRKQETPTLAEIGAGERGVVLPNLQTLSQAPVLNGLEKAFGEKGKALADAIRLARAASDTAKEMEPKFGPRSASNMKNADNGAALYENPLATDRNVIDNTTALMGSIGATQVFTQPHVAAGLLTLAGARALWQMVKNGRKLNPEQRTQFAQFMFALRRGEHPEAPRALEGPETPPQLPPPPEALSPPGPPVKPVRNGFGSSSKQPSMQGRGLKSAAIRYKGKTYRASTHDEAYRMAGLSEDRIDDAVEGYILSNGRFALRDSPEAISEALAANQVDPQWRQSIENTLKYGSGMPLISDYIKFSKPLPMDEASRMGRAREQGFTIDAYHGTSEDISEFAVPPPFRAGMRNDDAVFFTAEPDIANSYATWKDRRDTPSRIAAQQKGDDGFIPQGSVDRYSADALFPRKDRPPVEKYKEGANVMPVKLRLRNPLAFDAKGKLWARVWPDAMVAAKRGGHDGVIMKNVDDWGDGMMGREARSGVDKLRGRERAPRTVYAVFDSNNVRSKFAAFDPAEQGSSRILAGTGNGLKGAIASQVGPPAAAATIASVGPEGESAEDKAKRMMLWALAAAGVRNAKSIRSLFKSGAEKAVGEDYARAIASMQHYRKMGSEAMKLREQGVDDIIIARRLGLDQSMDGKLSLDEVRGEVQAAIDTAKKGWPEGVPNPPETAPDKSALFGGRKPPGEGGPPAKGPKLVSSNAGPQEIPSDYIGLGEAADRMRKMGASDKAIASRLGLDESMDGPLSSKEISSEVEAAIMAWRRSESPATPAKPKPTQASFGSGGGKGISDAIVGAYGNLKQGMLQNDPRQLNSVAEIIQGMGLPARAGLESNAKAGVPLSAIEAAGTPTELAELVGRSGRVDGRAGTMEPQVRQYQTRLADQILGEQRTEPDLINADRRAGPIGAMEKGILNSYDWTPAREAQQEAALARLISEGSKPGGGLPNTGATERWSPEMLKAGKENSDPTATALDRFRQGVASGESKSPLDLSPKDVKRLADLIFNPGSAKDTAALATTPIKPWVSDIERRAIQVGVPAAGLAALVAGGASLYNQPGGDAGGAPVEGATARPESSLTDAILEQLGRGLRGPSKEGMKKRLEEHLIDASRDDFNRPKGGSGGVYTVPNNLLGTNNPAEPPPELNGLNTDTRTRAQQRLMALGYAPTKLQSGARFDDGIDGPQLRAAVSALQRDKGLPVTGDLDPMTLRALWNGENFGALPTMRAYGEERASAPQ